MKKKKVLFICVHNSARSQMAEAFLNDMGSGLFVAESAGLEPGKLNPLAVEAMKETGLDISRNQTKSAFAFYQQGKRYDYVITVCNESNSERCPIFPGTIARLHWGFPDPSSFEGGRQKQLEKTREVRDKIKAKIENWLKQFQQRETQ